MVVLEHSTKPFRATGKVNAPRFQFHREQQIERHQTRARPDFNAAMSDLCQRIHIIRA